MLLKPAGPKLCQKLSILAVRIFGLVLPSQALFIALPLFLKQGLNYHLSMGIAVACYRLMMVSLDHVGIRLQQES